MELPSSPVTAVAYAVPPSPGECVFRREGEYWTIIYGGTVIRLRDIKGLRYLAHLLVRSGQAVSAEDLIQLVGEVPSRSAEAARSAVTKRIRDALRKIEAHLPALGSHLRTAVSTGYRCRYRPAPKGEVQWQL